MIAILLIVIAVFLLSTLIGHFLHWALHQNWTGRLKKSHMAHHLKMYPPSNFSSDVYRGTGKDSSLIFFIIALIPLIILLIIIGLLINSVPAMIAGIVTLVLNGLLHNYIHDSFHINKSWVRRFSSFQRLEKLHYIHHANMRKNFGIFTFYWDRLFGSFKDYK